MPRTQEINTLCDFKFSLPMRAIFAGSSQSGKTYMIGKIIENANKLFGREFEAIKYFYPEYLDESPVDFHKTTDSPISYITGFPKKSDISGLVPNSLIIIDDMADQAVKSDLVSQIYKVISGKKHLSIILVTQNYFVQGRHSREIRNSCNYVGLFRNCGDASLNRRVTSVFGLRKAYDIVERTIFRSEVYPFVFIDQRQVAQIGDYRLYTSILGNVKIAYSTNGMRGYVLNEETFKRIFNVISQSANSVTAVPKNEDSQESVCKRTQNREVKFKQRSRRDYKPKSKPNKYDPREIYREIKRQETFE